MLEIIKKHRLSLGLTQKDLAEMLKISQKSVSEYENGTTKPSSAKLPLLAEIFGISVDDLIGERDFTITQKEKTQHGNSRASKLIPLYEKLPPEDQKMILKQVRVLVEHHEKGKKEE